MSLPLLWLSEVTADLGGVLVTRNLIWGLKEATCAQSQESFRQVSRPFGPCPQFGRLAVLRPVTFLSLA